MKMLIKLSATVFLSSLLGCAGAPKPPEGHLCGVNAKSSYMLCFDLSQDFDSEGRLKAGTKGVKTPITLMSLQGGWFVDSPTKESVQAYALKWKQRYQALEKNCNY